MVYTFWHENVWRCLAIKLFPSSGSHKHAAHFPSGFDWSKVIFWRIDMAFSCASLSPSNVII